MKLARRLGAVRPSATLEASARAAALKAQGVDVIGFTAGEPDFDTPAHVKEAAKRAIDAGYTKYTAVAGALDLRRAVAGELKRAHGLDFAPEQVIVSNGAKHSLYTLFQALLDEGDEVLVPAPYWVSYPDIVRLAGGVPRIVPTRAEEGFVPSAASLEEATGARTRAVILNFPTNPTGATVPRASLEAFAEWAVRHDAVVVSDDIYRRLVYGPEPFVQIATLGPEVARRTMIVDGLSKSHAMTGWRCGFCAGPADVIAAMTTLQGQQTSNPSSITQAAALAALTGPQDSVEQMRHELDRRRRAMYGALADIPGVRLVEPHGAFYCFPDVTAYLGRHTPKGRLLADDEALTEYLLEQAHVACVPGASFGGPGHIRLSYTTSLDKIVEGVRRIRAALEALR